MDINQKDKKEVKSKKQVQSKESRTLRLIKERKRKAQLRTNPALSIYESGRERTKRVVKKEYPLVNINKLPTILTKGNDNIGVVWKNTNKIQSHTLFSETNLPCREPASKEDIYYYVAPFKEPNTVDIVDEFKKFKVKFAKENQNRYLDLKTKTVKSKVPSSKLHDSCQKKFEQKSNVPTSFLNDNMSNYQQDTDKFVDGMDDGTYQETLKNNFIPFISKFSINPLTKGRIISELGLDKTSKNNNINESLHKVKKKINKNNMRNKFGDNFLMNKGLNNNNFDSIINAIQPLESIISSRPLGFNQSLITEQNVTIPNLDFLDDSMDLNKIKMENNILLGENSNPNKKEDEDFLMNLLTMNENQKLENELLNNSLEMPLFNNFDNGFGNISPSKPMMPLPKPQHTGTLDEILAPFKVPVDDNKVKVEENKIDKSNVNAFNCFNFDDMDLPKIELPQDIIPPNMGLDNIGFFNNGFDLDNSIFKKEFPSHKIYEKKSNVSLGEIAKFGNNDHMNKLKPVKTEELPQAKIKSDSFDLRKVKHENDTMPVDLVNPQLFSPISVLDQVDNVSFLNNLLNDNGSLINVNNDILPPLENPGIAIDCYNTEMNFVNNTFVLPNTINYENNLIKPSPIIPKESLLPSPEVDIMKDVQFDINTISKNTLKEPLQNCCTNTIPLTTTTTSNVKSIPDWYNQDGFGFFNPDSIAVENVQKDNSPQLMKPLVPPMDATVAEKMITNNFAAPQSIPDIPKEILNETNQYSSFLEPEIPPSFTEASKVNIIKKTGSTSSIDATEKKETEELSEKIVEEIIDRVSKDDKLKEKTGNTCFAGQNIQDTGKMLKKMSKEIDELVSEQLEASEKKWKEWRKDIKDYENEAHQWLNARIEFYSRRVNEYRKDWIEYWIKRYLMQQKQQIKSLSYYINIPQNLQFASNLNLEADDSNTTANGTTNTTSNENANGTSDNKKNVVKSVGRETIEQFKKSSTTLIALTAEVSKDPRLEVIGRTIEVANKDLLNNPSLIKEYHEKLLIEKKLLLEKYDIVDSLDIIPTNLIKPITNLGDNELVNCQNEFVGDSNGNGYKRSRSDDEEIASVLIDEYVKAPFESKRIFIHGIPKDYQLMFNDKMKSLIFILDKCIQDKKDLYSTMADNRKKYSIENET